MSITINVEVGEEQAQIATWRITDDGNDIQDHIVIDVGPGEKHQFTVETLGSFSLITKPPHQD